MATVRIPPVLRPKTGGQSEVEAAGRQRRRGPARADRRAPRTEAQLVRRGRRAQPLRQRLPQRRGRAGARRARDRGPERRHRRHPAGDGRRPLSPPSARGRGRGTAWSAPRAGRRAPVCGGPCSTITPSSMKTTRSPTSRAKPISWVTTIIVMPSAGQLAHHVEHLLDELRIERAGDLVEEHHAAGPSPAPGRSRPAAAGRPRAVRGTGSSLSARPTRSSSAVAFVRGLVLRIARAPSPAPSSRSRSAVLCGKRLNCWKTIPTRWRTKLRFQLGSPSRAGALADVLALEEDLALLGRLEQVDAAQQRALARAARAEDADHFALRRPRGRRRSAPRARRSACGSLVQQRVTGPSARSRSASPSLDVGAAGEAALLCARSARRPAGPAAG